MQQDTKNKSLRGAWVYVFNALKFYDLKQDNVAAVVFTAIFAIGFAGVFIPGADDLTSLVFITYNIISIIGIYLISLIYQGACIKEVKGEEYSLKECTLDILKKSFPLVVSSLLFLLGTTTGLLLLIIPGIIFNFTFMFYTCLIIDKKTGVIESFKRSKKLSQGRKLELFSIVFLFSFIIMMPVMLLIMIFSSPEDTLVFNFVITFTSSITNLMQHRLTALLYMDLEYGVSSDLE